MRRGCRIDLKDIRLTFRGSDGRVEALAGVTLAVEHGEFVSLIGPSGCGKSTLLNVIAGFLSDTPSAGLSGEVLVDGVRPQREALRSLGVGYVFQKDALLPWRSVADNVRVALEIRGVPRREQERRLGEMIGLVGLSGFESRFPHQLSGGMRQRVALIRTLVYEPRLILMDEPFGALDAQTRMLLQDELLRLWQYSGATILFVTHDLDEAITLSGRVVLMAARPGSIKREYRVDIPHPRSAFTARFSDEYRDLHRRIWDDLRTEVVKPR